MECPKCSFEHADQQAECLRCGVIFAKYRRRPKDAPQTEPPAAMPADPAPGPGQFIKELLFYVTPETNPLIFGGRALFYLVIFIWGLKFIVTPMESKDVLGAFWHLVNLPFHEVGHILFRPFGRLMTSLGGSILQVLMPLICLVVFLIKTRDTFAASFTLWWTGESFMDLAPYINDARSLTLPLLGGNTGLSSPYGFHDWEFILQETRLLRYDHFLANSAKALGTVLMIGALAWGGYILFKQYQNLAGSKKTAARHPGG
jgi:hypothetical protein